MALKIQQLTTVIGAEIEGAELEKLDNSEFEQIERALVAHQVIFLRDQPTLDPATQISFARQFGPLHTHPAAPTLNEHPEIFICRRSIRLKAEIYCSGLNKAFCLPPGTHSAQ